MLELIPFVFLTFYLVPFMVAVARNHDSPMLILVANLLLGWTVVGWLVLLGLAMASGPERRAA